MKKVWVVTGLELGWDCVVGVWDAGTTDFKALCEEYGFDPESGESNGYIIHEHTLETEI